MINWLKKKKKGIIRSLFLIPIILVAIISISHVIAWYDLSNPLKWAIFLSVAIEVGAMVSLAAASVKIKRGVWVVFAIVTLVQLIGNIFYSYKEIDVTSYEFNQWVELTGPLFDMMGTSPDDVIGHKRWLAILTGGLLPIISLASLHFFIKYDEKDEEDGEGEKVEPENPTPEPTPENPLGFTDEEIANNNALRAEEIATSEMIEKASDESEIMDESVEVVDSDDEEVMKPEPIIPNGKISKEDIEKIKQRERNFSKNIPDNTNRIERIGSNKITDDGGETIHFRRRRNS